MTFISGIAASVGNFLITEVAKCLIIDPLKRHVGYMLDRNKKLQELKTKIELLQDERGKVKNAVDAAQRKGERIEEDVSRWLIRVDKKINEEADKVKALEEKAKKRCFIGLCPNFKSYYQLGKKVEEDAKVVCELIEQGRFVSISHRPALEGIGTVPVRDYEAFESRASTLEGIMESLRNPSVRMIGVHGMAGVGKTTLVKEVARKAREEYLFDEVVMVAISHSPNIRNIQGQIADMMGFRFDEETDDGRSKRLRQVFQERKKSEKKILVILDDIWASFDFEAIGIWLEEEENRASNEKQESCKHSSPVPTKILLTSRSQDVLKNMNAEGKFEIRVLSKKEAMIWFGKIVGDAVEKPDYKIIAKKVVEKCACLPVAISVIAKALRHKELHIWEDVLRRLRLPKPMNVEMDQGVYSVIKVSYDALKSKELQSLLQLCSWAPQGSRIYEPYLLRSSLGLDLLEDVDTLKEARNSLRSSLDQLKASSLLLEGDTSEYVNMHDLLRDVCIYITCKDEQIIVTDEADLKSLLRKKKQIGNCKAINLKMAHSKTHELPDMLDCPNLKFLVLWSDDPLSQVSENFFIAMNELRVLQLGGMSFSSLPSSFLSLTNLQTLFLNDCKLQDIAIIGELKKLIALTLAGSHIEQLPGQIGQLTQLRLLDLGDCSKLVVIPCNLISSLTCLEELYMGNSFDRWGVEGNAGLAELMSLCHLTTLDVHISEAQILGGVRLFSEKWERYKIFIGDHVWDWSDEHRYSRTLKLKLNTSVNLDSEIIMLLNRTEDLYVEELKGVSSVLYESGFPVLKSLHVQNNLEVEYIIGSVGRIAFPVLESLFLHSLINLKKICGEVGVGSFAGLRIIKVGSCSALENLFSFSLASKLSQLQEIEVIDCASMVEIIAAEAVIDCASMVEIVAAEGEENNEASGKTVLRHLRSLTLQRLPRLISFFSRENNIRPNISLPLFTEKMVFSYLENLRLSSINNESIWHNRLSMISSSCIQNLTSLIVENCNNLKQLLSTSMARTLKHIKYFEIIKCKCLRAIIFTEDVEEQDKASISFPQLNSLKMKDLQHLTGFCSENLIIEFPSLKLLEVDNCVELKGFMNNNFSIQAFFNEKVAFPSLEKMTVSRLRNMKMLWHNQLSANSFSKLEEMTIEHCEELLTIFPSNILGTFKQLHTLTVSSCVSLEKVFELGTLDMEERASSVVGSKLKELYVFDLPRLEYIWSSSKDLQAIFSFGNLSVLTVSGCWRLKNVFPASVARVLSQLKDLVIAHSGVEELVSNDQGLTQAITFEFDNVSSLTLWNLPNLLWFYPGAHKTTWPKLEELKTYHCNRLKIFGAQDGQVGLPIQPPLFLVEKVIPGLEELHLNSNDISLMCNTQVSGRAFHDIKVLSVHCYHDESTIFPFTFLERFCNLERLEVICCEFKELFSYEGDIFEEIQARVYSRIKYFKLALLHNLKHVWEQDSRIHHILPNLEILEVVSCGNLISLGSSSASFTKLTTLDVWGCKALVNIAASSAIQSLVHLEKMVVTQCVSLKEIVGDEGNEETHNYIILRKLKYLELQHLPNLTSFSSSNHTFEFPSLEQVIVSQCPELNIFSRGVLSVPMLRRVHVTDKDSEGRWSGDLNSTIQQLYTEKAGYQGLERLELSKFSTSTEIWHQNLQRSLDFKSLKFLRVYDCDSLKFIFSISMALDLLELEEITVKNCPAMEQIIRNDEGEMIETIMFPWLQFVTLESCPNLKSFYQGSNTLECPLLKEIMVVDCPEMFAFASTFLGEQDTETNGGNVNRLATAHPFGDQILFPRLEKLELSSTKIKELWHGRIPAISSYAQNLTSLNVKGCDDLKCILSPSVVESFVQLKELSISNCANVEEVISIDGLGEAESMSEILFPQLEILELRNLPKLRRFCHGNYLEFPSLVIFKIEECLALETFISGFATEDETHQITQRVEESSSTVDIHSLFNEKVAFPLLKRLRIIGTGRWRRIWHDKLARDSFSELNLLLVDNCGTVLNIFPFNMRGRLENLDEMEIKRCYSLEEIFEPEELNVSELHSVTTIQSVVVETTIVKFVFPKLKYLRLSLLPKLKSFYSKMHTTEWPSMEQMYVFGCDNVEIFASEILDFGESADQQTLFWANEVTFPNLEELTLSWNDTMREIWHGQVPEKLFCKLKVLELVMFGEESAALPHCFIHSLPNLEKLVVNDAPFSHIFQCEGHGEEERHGSAMTQLSELRLTELPELTHIWKEEFQPMAAFCGLRTLKVKECGKLENFVPSSMSFANLTTLKVSGCHGFIHLISCSTAKSLMQLTKMSVVDCEIVKEIIACDGDECGICFTQLKVLRLSCLPSLASFCSPGRIIGFPSLESLTVNECPNMERGDLRTPNLQEVQLTEDEDGEENVLLEDIILKDLETSIQQLSEEMHVQSSED